jgi:hypothetical protein
MFWEVSKGFLQTNNMIFKMLIINSMRCFAFVSNFVRSHIVNVMSRLQMWFALTFLCMIICSTHFSRREIALSDIRRFVLCLCVWELCQERSQSVIVMSLVCRDTIAILRNLFFRGLSSCYSTMYHVGSCQGKGRQWHGCCFQNNKKVWRSCPCCTGQCPACEAIKKKDVLCFSSLFCQL